MELLQLKRLRNLINHLDEFGLGLDGEDTSHSSPPEQTEERGRKSHIPSVTTVPRETRATSGDRQARRRPIAVPDEKEATPGSSPATTNTPTTAAEAGQVHDTPNPVEDSRSGDRSTPAAKQGSKAAPCQSGAAQRAPNISVIFY